VRVADNPIPNRFLLPGLLDAASLRPAVARARSGGSWSDDLWTGTVQESRVLEVAGFELRPGGYQLHLLASSDALTVGDLVEVRFDAADLLLYLPIEQIQGSSQRQTVEGRRGFWFLRHRNPSSPPVNTAEVWLLHPDGEEALPLASVDLPQQVGDPCRIQLSLGLAEAPTVGALLRIDFDDESSLLCPVADVAGAAAESGSPPTSPPQDHVWITCDAPRWLLTESEGRSRLEASNASPPALPLATRVRFGIWLWREHELQSSLVDLGFAAAHPRFWGTLPTDEPLFAWPTGEPRQRPSLPFEAEVKDPRFPLAGPATPAPLYLPVNMAIAPSAQASLPRLAVDGEGTALERDGLANFGAHLFVDERLAGLGVRSLLAEANDRFFLQDNPPLAPLTGLHSLLPVSEASLLSVPDAVHTGWEEQTTPPPDLLPAPTLLAVDPVAAGFYLARWTLVIGASAYLLEEGSDPAFSSAVVRYQGSETETEIFVPPDCPGRHFFRVRALRQNETSPWSNTLVELLPEPQFLACEQQDLAAPAPQIEWLSSPPGTEYRIHWGAVTGATGYRLEESPDPLFRVTSSVIEGGETTATIRYRGESVYFYRVRVHYGDEIGVWSTTRAVLAAPRTRWVTQEGSDPDQSATLLAVQRALLRFCAARGDLFTVLTLPAAFRTDEALRYHTLLRPRGDRTDEPAGEALIVPPLAFDEAWLLSYGALYHPWLLIQAGGRDSGFRYAPPDGAIVGLLAAVALGSGAWRAPANRPLRGILGLAQEFERDGWAGFYRAQINLIRQEPGNFTPMSADTLSPNREVRPIHVRRLLTLLRRLVLREGNTYVFAPSTPQFRRRVQHRFEQVMAQLHQRGAFAGVQPESAYRVVTDASVNPPASLDQGRFVVELRIAPAQALAFLTVRLIQNDRENLLFEEF
jgi:hypothetical protein